MDGVCSIDLQCSHERTFGHKGHQCALVSLWNAKRMTLICPYTSLGGQQPSKWEFPFLPKSIHDRGKSRSDDPTRKVRAKVRCSCALLLTADILMHAADKGVGAVQMLRMKSNSVARSCPREHLQMVFADIAVGTTTVQVGQNVFGGLAADRHTTSYRAGAVIRHVHFIWSTKNRYNVLDATMTVKSSHVLQTQWMNNASEFDAQFEQHRKVHLIDKTCCSCVCLSVFHVDPCGHTVHDFDGSLHANTNDSPRHSVVRKNKRWDSSCSVRLFPPCCLQHGLFGPVDDRRGGHPTTLLKQHSRFTHTRIIY